MSRPRPRFLTRLSVYLNRTICPQFEREGTQCCQGSCGDTPSLAVGKRLRTGFSKGETEFNEGGAANVPRLGEGDDKQRCSTENQFERL